MRMIYGRLTESFEDAKQCVILDMSAETHEQIESENLWEALGYHIRQGVVVVDQKTIVAWEDVVESLTLLLDDAGTDPVRTIHLLADALDI